MATKINPKVLREKARKKNIRSITALAAHLGCSRQAIYFALENPSRFSCVYQKIKEAIYE
jgi:predicted transcriptional regulator